MLEPIVRILLRYLAIPALLWLGMPEDVAKALLEDPDVQLAIMLGLPAAAALVEGWYVWAKRKGRSV